MGGLWQSERGNDSALKRPELWWAGALPLNAECLSHPSEHRHGFGTQFSHDAAVMRLNSDFAGRRLDRNSLVTQRAPSLAVHER